MEDKEIKGDRWQTFMFWICKHSFGKDCSFWKFHLIDIIILWQIIKDKKRLSLEVHVYLKIFYTMMFGYLTIQLYNILLLQKFQVLFVQKEIQKEKHLHLDKVMVLVCFKTLFLCLEARVLRSNLLYLNYLLRIMFGKRF